MYFNYQTWGEEIRTKAAEDEVNRVRAAEEQESRLENIRKMKQLVGEYWKGPFGVNISWNLKGVPSEDRVNSLIWYPKDDGYEIISTQLFAHGTPYSDQEYKDKFCEQRGDNWYFVRA